jgi:nuclear transport factor 2 (NTF2) superfamily protein
MADATAIPGLYDAFNARDVDGVLAALAPDVRWPNAWEGGWVNGHEEIRRYWRRQWAEIDPYVEPVAIDERPDGTVAVRVHQIVRDLDGNLLDEGEVLHVYRFEGGLVVERSVEEA